MGLLYVRPCTSSAHFCVCLSSLGLSLGIAFPIVVDKDQMRELDDRISPLIDSKTLQLCFHPLCRCTCQRGYVGDGSTCYGNIMERLRELNTEPRGKWQGSLTSFISLLGTQLWVQIPHTGQPPVRQQRLQDTVIQKGVGRLGKACLLGPAMPGFSQSSRRTHNTK